MGVIFVIFVQRKIIFFIGYFLYIYEIWIVEINLIKQLVFELFYVLILNIDKGMYLRIDSELQFREYIRVLEIIKEFVQKVLKVF